MLRAVVTSRCSCDRGARHLQSLRRAGIKRLDFAAGAAALQRVVEALFDLLDDAQRPNGRSSVVDPLAVADRIGAARTAPSPPRET